MAAKTKTNRRRPRQTRVRRRARKAAPAPRRATRRTAARSLDRAWKDTRAALSSAETSVEKNVRALVKRSGLDTREARKSVNLWTARFERERKKAFRRLESRFAELQARAKKERRALGKATDGAVQRTLAALNIPSRREVQELTRRVGELSRRIDRLRR
jgi:polyhydroxyalkanoate synthesis regulator phasin